MAHLPARRDSESLTPAEDKFREIVADALARGHKPGAIARAIARGDPKRAKTLRAKIRRLVRTDKDFHRRIAERAHGNLVIALGPATEALGRRASRGNPQALKLLFESSGFYNPKVDHEHSGDITIRLEIPRPPVQQDALPNDPAPVIEGEVVDES